MKLYKVRFINQETGAELDHYVLADNLQHLESEYADIIRVEPLTPLENLTEEDNE